eukprot:CAMPEP_0198345072 /NCGR_PEP_ID=MMETSP1450-20131203/71871_1 /TAXON_ID=753684 ORGANISM="Madagascaria erythrocladiodes, Strain CCMP3234" /NCGR_SAMPLE_ID=MMETSP1450 /ASSEMBLY_ACC=CAM_ASM_001115 /LENGTH=52 /DNA_ID=CAMNT_0044050393 /DNA_START=9 /DNA_END=163 /DNA_ORIENTATION=-
MLPHAVHRVDVAGRHLTYYVTQLLNERGYPFGHLAGHDVERDIKETLAYVAL